MLRIDPQRGPYICFYETNPPILRLKIRASFVLQDICIVCRVFLQVGSFSKTNPKKGRFEGCFDDNSPISTLHWIPT